MYGFALIELFVVISIIALLVAILMPPLSKAKQQATWAVCQVTAKQLLLVWFRYQEDNDGRIMHSDFPDADLRTSEQPLVPVSFQCLGRILNSDGIQAQINNCLTLRQTSRRGNCP